MTHNADFHLIADAWNTAHPAAIAAAGYTTYISAPPTTWSPPPGGNSGGYQQSAGPPTMGAPAQTSYGSTSSV